MRCHNAWYAMKNNTCKASVILSEYKFELNYSVRFGLRIVYNINYNNVIILYILFAYV